MTVLALDVGGTKIGAAFVAPDGRLLRTAVRPTPADDVLTACIEVLNEVAEPGVRALGIGSAGPVDAVRGTVSPVNIASWRDFPLVEQLAEVFPGVRVRLAGDGACMALAEHRTGAGRGVPDLLGVVVSTGVGGGLVLGGEVVGGRTGNAAHLGHVVAEPDGEPCPCGGVGCLERVASGPSAVRWARSHGWTGADARALAAAARAGAPVPVAALDRAGQALGRGLASAVTLLDLDLVVLGGGFAAAGSPLWVPMRRAMRRHAGMGFVRGARVVPAALGPEAGLVGAAALVLDHPNRST